MREEHISFWESIEIPGHLYLFFTNKAAKEDIHKKICKRKTFMALVGHNKEGEIIYLNTDKEELACVLNDEGVFSVIGVGAINFFKNNRMMQRGTPIRVDEVVVDIASKDLNTFALFTKDGEVDRNKNKYSKVAAVKYIEDILHALRANARMYKENDEEEEPYQPHKILERKLTLAEHYANSENDLADQAAQKNRLAYHRIEPSDYDRRDRTAYIFITEKFKEEDYRVGAQVELKGMDEMPCTAEVISVDQGREDGESHLGLLFNGQVGLEKLNEAGWISLSFSTVVRDVQLASIEKIRTGKAAAQYMDAILGEAQPTGFFDTDLTALEEQLRRKKHPPTPSQMKAICNGIRAKDAYLVMGPPGTGKTTVILEWVKYFVQQGKRVLVSSQNNKAVDNVLARLIEEENINIIRIGSEAKVQTDIHECLFEHKVAHTRQEIAEKTAENIVAAESMQKEWGTLARRLADFAECLVALEAREQHLKDTLIPQLIQCGGRLAPCYEAYQTAYRIAENKRKSVQKRYDRMMNHPTEGLAGLWARIRNYFDRRRMRGDVQAYDIARVQEIEATAAYNEARRAYEDLYKGVYEDDYAPLLESRMLREEEYTALQIWEQEAKTLNKAGWNFFTDPFPSEMHACAITRYEQSIAADEERFAEFIRHLKDWQQKNENKQDYSLKNMILESVDLVGATCIGVNSQKRFADLAFDVTIIDEAGQIQIHNALVPMSVSNKLIMLGDHRQIPPSLDQELEKLCDANGIKTKLLEKSLFEDLYEDLPESNKVMLDTQFRMPPEIAAIISHEFYEGKYHSIPDWKAGISSHLPSLSQARLVVIDTSAEQSRIESKIEGGGTYNVFEADIIVRLVRALMQQPDFKLNELGVISAYKAQVKKIQGALKSILTEDERRDVAATLDSFQGQERDVIIYSFTRSSHKPPHVVRIGFLNELRRLNVAMTRCKEMLILVGDMNFLSSCTYEKPDEDGNLTEETYARSEKRFSAFIRAMLDGVRNGVDGWPAGEIVSYDEFNRRMEGIENGGR